MAVTGKFVIKLKKGCLCLGCQEKVKAKLVKVKGVEKKWIDIDAEQKEVRISAATTAAVDPQALILALGKDGDGAQILEGTQTSLTTTDKMQTVPVKMPLQAVADDLCIHVFKGKGVDNAAGKTSNPAPDEHDEMELSKCDKNLTCKSCKKDEMELKKSEKNFTCDGCGEKGFGSRYRCRSCDYELHKECMFPNQTIRHQFFEECVFKFVEQPEEGRCCDACGNHIRGFAYHSKAKGWDLHPCCSNLQDRLCLDGVDFVLGKKKISSSSKCMWCKKRKPGGNRARVVPGWSYTSSCRTFHIHVHCVTEMVHEAWTKGVIETVDDQALKEMNLKLVLNSNNRSGGESKVRVLWKTVEIFLSTILGILLGNPSPILASLLLGLVTN